MKKIFALSFCLIAFNTCIAQVTFEKVIDTLGSGGITCIQETFDGGYVYCGGSTNGGNDVLVAKIDSTGTIEWVKIYSGPGMESATYIEQTPDSGYMVNFGYIAGSNALNCLMRLDTNGDTLWTKTYSVGANRTIPSQANSMASVNNAIYGLTGYHSPASMSIAQAFFLASLGNGFFLSSHIYSPTPYGSDSRSIDKTYDNGFIMAGGIGTASSSTDVYLIRTDAYGDTLWTRTYDRTQNDVAFDVKQTSDSGFILAAVIYDPTIFKNNIYLIKTDSVGDTLWTKQYPSPFHQVPYSIQQTNDKGYILAGYTNNSLGRDLFLMKTNSTGDTIWTRTMSASSNCSGYFVRQTKDGGYIISGISQMPPGGSYIIKTDSLGMVNSATGIAEVNNPLQFEVYPNPASEYFAIRLKGLACKETRLELYDLSGRTIEVLPVCTNQEETIRCDHLPEGIYNMVLRKDNQVFSRRLLIQRK